MKTNVLYYCDILERYIPALPSYQRAHRVKGTPAELQASLFNKREAKAG